VLLARAAAVCRSAWRAGAGRATEGRMPSSDVAPAIDGGRGVQIDTILDFDPPQQNSCAMVQYVF